MILRLLDPRLGLSIGRRLGDVYGRSWGPTRRWGVALLDGALVVALAAPDGGDTGVRTVDVPIRRQDQHALRVSGGHPRCDRGVAWLKELTAHDRTLSYAAAVVCRVKVGIASASSTAEIVGA